MTKTTRISIFSAAIFILTGCCIAAFAQEPGNRLFKPINENESVTLAGNVHPMARGEFDRGAASLDMRLDHMILQLEPSAAQQAELEALVAEQHNPASPLYHQWLTPTQFGARFGASASEVATIAAWLASHGFTVDEIPAGNRQIVFSGTAAQVSDAFHTEIHHYLVNGVSHIANARDPEIPAALSGVVSGIVSLHDFRRQSAIHSRTALGAHPEDTSGGGHYLLPADWAAIYDLNSLYKAGTTGSGASIAIVGRSNINLTDVAAFRSQSGLPANNPAITLVNTNPGLVAGDQDESTLDVEWAGAVAPAATVKFVVAASTATSDGVDLSAQYIVNHNTAQVMSTSYGSCEADMGTAENAFYNSLWQQAASEGISAFVSAGDSGAAGCYSGSATSASGTGVNGLCSSPYSTCVGGTEFNEGSNPAQYWSASNGASGESALGYIPEKVWNESASNGGSGLWASGGGVSLVYTQPAWQKNVAGTAAANGMRAVPDVAVTAASHDGYIVVLDGSQYIFAGTSAASPSFAGVMALVVQSKKGVGQGNANPALYALLDAAKNPFHATPSGNNSVPGVTGFTASGASYNLSTGLGSVDGAVLVSAWGGGSSTAPATDFTLKASSASGTVQTGSSTSFTVTVTESGTAKNSVALSASAPTGVTVSFSPASILPGATATVTVSVASSAAPGAQTITISGKDSTGTQSLSYALNVTQPPTLALSAANSTLSVMQGTSGTVALTATTGGSYTGELTFSLSGLPSGVTASWSANPLSATSGTGTEKQTLTLTAASTVAAGSAAVKITVAGDGLTATQSVTLQIQAAPGIQLAFSPASLSMQTLATATTTVTATPQGGVAIPAGAAGSSIAIASGLPTGVTATWSAPSLGTSGVLSWTLTLTGSSKAVAGTSSLSIAAKIVAKSGSSYTKSATLPLTVTPTPPSLTVTPASSALAVIQGKSVTDVFTLTGNATYSGAAAMSISGLPAGVTASWSSQLTPTSSQAGSAALTLTASASAAVGAYSLTVKAVGDGLTVTKTITLQVQQAPAVKIAVASSSISVSRIATNNVTVTATAVGGLNAQVALSVSGLPAGVTASFTKSTISAPGSGSVTLTFTAGSAAKTGSYQVTVAATPANSAAAVAQTITLTLK
jgi:subtilase family serine protease